MSLAVLGLIAGLTVPSIINSVEKSKAKSLLKEAFQLVSSINSDAVLNGDYNNITDWNAGSTATGSIVAYFSSKLSYTKQCLLGDTTSAGCVPHLVNGANESVSLYNHSARWVLPNGVKLIALISGPTLIGWYIGVSATDGNWTSTTTSTEFLNLFCNPTDASATLYGTPMKAGQCVARAGYESQLNTLMN